MLSKQDIKNNCPHCDPKHEAMKDVLEATKNFWVVCDHSPLTLGHILIIPKKHLSCVGVYSPTLLKEFEGLYIKAGEFLLSSFGCVSSFEHGIIGQTVFHSHFHLVPFLGTPLQIIPEGESFLQPTLGIKTFPDIFKKDGQYLFFSIGKKNWLVDTKLGAPRFFRDRFAQALGKPERGNWKQMNQDGDLMKEAALERKKLMNLWKKYFI